MNSKYLLAILVVLTSAAFAQAAPNDKTPPSKANSGHPAAQASQQHQDEGTRIFEQNCSRCHNAPETFSPHIAGTIVEHMRVRASLSKQDEEQLLRFFNPQ